MLRLPSIVCLLLLLFASCSSAPVWRSPNYGPDKPAPTLLAAAVYDFTLPENELSLTNIGSNVRKIATAITGQKAVQATASGMHPKLTAFLAAQGFQLETDLTRSTKLTNDGMAAGDYLVVMPDTVARPFGQYMLFGPGSKSSIAERLQTERQREAYASILVGFESPGSSLENGVTCNIWIQVLDRTGTPVLEARVSGSAEFRAAPNTVVQQAFDRALAGLQQVVVQA
jgi:hypothetical protein